MDVHNSIDMDVHDSIDMDVHVVITDDGKEVFSSMINNIDVTIYSCTFSQHRHALHPSICDNSLGMRVCAVINYA